MQAVQGDEFLNWVARAGVGFDPRYPDAHSLRFIPPLDHSRFWSVPLDPGTWPRLLKTLLAGLDPWTAGYLWPRSGVWPHARRSQGPAEAVRDVMLRGSGVPDGWAGAIRIGRDEEASLLAVFFACLAFSSCVDDDLYFIPEHGRQILLASHHELVHAECLSQKRIRELVTHMAKEAYELPTEPPDATFKRPAWMDGSNAGVC